MNGHDDGAVSGNEEKEESNVNNASNTVSELGSSRTSTDEESMPLEEVKLHEKLTDPTKFAFCSLAAVVLRLDFGEEWNK